MAPKRLFEAQMPECAGCGATQHVTSTEVQQFSSCSESKASSTSSWPLCFKCNNASRFKYIFNGYALQVASMQSAVTRGARALAEMRAAFFRAKMDEVLQTTRCSYRTCLRQVGEVVRKRRRASALVSSNVAVQVLAVLPTFSSFLNLGDFARLRRVHSALLCMKKADAAALMVFGTHSVKEFLYFRHNENLRHEPELPLSTLCSRVSSKMFALAPYQSLHVKWHTRNLVEPPALDALHIFSYDTLTLHLHACFSCRCDGFDHAFRHPLQHQTASMLVPAIRSPLTRLILNPSDWFTDDLNNVLQQAQPAELVLSTFVPRADCARRSRGISSMCVLKVPRCVKSIELRTDDYFERRLPRLQLDEHLQKLTVEVSHSVGLGTIVRNLVETGWLPLRSLCCASFEMQDVLDLERCAVFLPVGTIWRVTAFRGWSRAQHIACQVHKRLVSPLFWPVHQLNAWSCRAHAMCLRVLCGQTALWTPCPTCEA